MAEKYGIYKCEKCGNISQVLHAEKSPVVCCGQLMDRVVAREYCNLHGLWEY